MASPLEGVMPWHDGENIMHNVLSIADSNNPTSLFLFPAAGYFLRTAPLLALGTLDDKGRPWTTLWGGERGFAKPLGSSIIGVKAVVDQKNDPLFGALFHCTAGEATKRHDEGKMISGLAFDLESRQRIKLYGKMVAGTLGAMNGRKDKDRASASICTIELVLKIEQSLANCPKYMNSKHIKPSIPIPRLVSDSSQLPEMALVLLSQADLFFVSSANQKIDMDTNIRGGPPGFIRVLSNSTAGAVIVWPEYSGNRLYQTLGNLQTTPLAGLVVPDFDTGNVLYATGRTEIFIGKQAANLLPGSNLAVKIALSAATFVENGLSFRGDLGERSPYNPKVRYLSTEKAAAVPRVKDERSSFAKLIKKEILTPTIARLRFRISDPVAAINWKPGQFVTLSLGEELDEGYSHMRDDDPRSLNDDYLRTFTVSSFSRCDAVNDEFEITIRKVGKVTRYLFDLNERSGLEIPLRGFGGEFCFHETEREGLIPFVASGVGITPLLGQLLGINVSKVRLFWTVNVKDVALVYDTFSRFPELPKTSTIFVTGSPTNISGVYAKNFGELSNLGAQVKRRRLQANDLHLPGAKTWYICTGKDLRTAILNWLTGTMVIYENFDY